MSLVTPPNSNGWNIPLSTLKNRLKNGVEQSFGLAHKKMSFKSMLSLSLRNLLPQKEPQMLKYFTIISAPT